MTSVYGSGLPVRQEIESAHRRLLDHWAQAGDWWSGPERLAMVAEVRTARAADRLPPWEAPSQVEGLVDPDHVLPVPVVDAIWRISNHPGTLTEPWHGAVLDAGVDPVAYVELVSVVAMANAVEIFGAALGFDSPELPTASKAAATSAPDDASVIDAHWVPTVPSELPNVRKALSAVPRELEMQGMVIDAQYVPGGALAGDITEKQWSLERTQMELIASRTSTLNECFY